MNEIVSDVKMVAYCGLYCGADARDAMIMKRPSGARSEHAALKTVIPAVQIVKNFLTP